MVKLEFYVPHGSAETVKEALFAVGVGRIGRYDRCSWETAGTGQFRGGDGARPVLGTPGRLERVAELKVEMVLEDHILGAAITALRETHPYEEPAFAVWKVSREIAVGGG